MRNYRTPAIVLRRHNVGEADRLMVVMTPELGKFPLRAKSVRRGASKLAGHLEPFCEIDLSIAKGRTLDVVTGARLVSVYDFDRSQIDNLAIGHLLLEAVDKLSVDHLPSPALYQLLKESLTALGSGVPIQILRHYFFIKALSAVGHRPNLSTNSVDRQQYLILDEGRLSDTSMGDHSMAIDIDTIKLWRLMASNSLAQVSRVRGVEKVIVGAQPLLDKFYQYHLGVIFRSELILSR